MKFRCDKGHIIFMRVDSLRNGHRCGECYKEYNLSFVKAFNDIIEQLGGKVIGKYVNKDTPIEVICKNGHSSYPRPGNVRNGQGICTICVNKDFNHTRESIKQKVKCLGGEILDDYKGIFTSIKIKCSCGYISTIIPQQIQKG